MSFTNWVVIPDGTSPNYNAFCYACLAPPWLRDDRPIYRIWITPAKDVSSFRCERCHSFLSYMAPFMVIEELE